MLIAVPVDKKEGTVTVSPSFGRAFFFFLYDPKNHHEEFIENAAAASQGGAGIKAAQQLVDKKVTIVLTPRCGENAAKVFQAAGIALFKTTGSNANDNINMFVAGELSPLDEIHPGFHNK